MPFNSDWLMKRVALISTPWPFFNRPSIQLGSLKAFVNQHIPHIHVDAHHFYLNIAAAIGYDIYHSISKGSWLSEIPYAALLFPEKWETIERFWKRLSASVPLIRGRELETLCCDIQRQSLRLVEKEDWDRYRLAGFSICFGQLTSSLYFIREIKKRAPVIKIVVGGSSCAGEMGESLHQTFSETDFVIRGEGEIPLAHLIDALWKNEEDIESIRVVMPSHSEAPRPQGGASMAYQVPKLDELPVPDFDDYFRQLGALDTHKMFFPRIPMEISRGCWWRKQVRPGGISGCAFCNLNLQWTGYRAKSKERTIRELDTLTDKYQLLSVFFMANLLPARELADLFAGIRTLGKDLRMFAEVRATTLLDALKAMGEAGVQNIQVGIEALSTKLLGKLNKGTTAMDNIEIIKNCEMPELPNLTGNLIMIFPTSDKEDVAETMQNLEFVFPFRPLKGIGFGLEYGSAVWRRPDMYAIKRTSNHLYYRYLFPKRILANLVLMNHAYRGTLQYQRRLWRPVKEKLKRWRKSYLKLHEKPGSGPILSYQDGKDFMIIRERCLGGHEMTHRLRGSSRKIYLYCQTQRTLREILLQFTGFGEEKVTPFLRMMVKKRLMFKEGEKYLSLAVPLHMTSRSLNSIIS